MVLGGGIPFYPRCERRLDLELLGSRTFSSRAVHLRYRSKEHGNQLSHGFTVLRS